MYPGDMIIENLSANGVQAEVTDISRDGELTKFVQEHPDQTSYLLPEGITANGWKKFAARLPPKVLVGLNGSRVKIGCDDGKNPVFHALHVVAVQ